MKNLIPYKEDCFEIHKKAVGKKHTGELKRRLEILNPLVEKEYKLFDERFSQKELHKLVSNLDLNASKEDLITLYSYQNSVIIFVRENIRKLQIKTIVNTCQNCTIDSANSFDHLLPKSKYPEFIVNPKNLFPCCSTCNSHKLNAISVEGNDVFLNLYLDELPIIQYLFVEVFLDNYSELNFRYYLDNVDNKINAVFFNVIVNHYTKLHLFERMRLRSIEYLSELETKILTFINRLSLGTIINDLTNAANLDKEAYGHNHWRCILELALLNSSLFTNKFI